MLTKYLEAKRSDRAPRTRRPRRMRPPRASGQARTPARRAGRRARPKRSRRRGEIDPSRNAGGVDAFRSDASPRTLFLRRRAPRPSPGAAAAAPRGAARQEATAHAATNASATKSATKSATSTSRASDAPRPARREPPPRKTRRRTRRLPFCDRVFVTASAGAAERRRRDVDAVTPRRFARAVFVVGRSNVRSRVGFAGIVIDRRASAHDSGGRRGLDLSAETGDVAPAQAVHDTSALGSPVKKSARSGARTPRATNSG